MTDGSGGSFDNAPKDTINPLPDNNPGNINTPESKEPEKGLTREKLDGFINDFASELLSPQDVKNNPQDREKIIKQRAMLDKLLDPGLPNSFTSRQEFERFLQNEFNMKFIHFTNSKFEIPFDKLAQYYPKNPDTSIRAFEAFEEIINYPCILDEFTDSARRVFKEAIRAKYGPEVELILERNLLRNNKMGGVMGFVNLFAIGGNMETLLQVMSYDEQGKSAISHIPLRTYARDIFDKMKELPPSDLYTDKEKYPTDGVRKAAWQHDLLINFMKALGVREKGSATQEQTVPVWRSPQDQQLPENNASTYSANA